MNHIHPHLPVITFSYPIQFSYNIEQIIYSNIRRIVSVLGEALTGLGIPSLGECGEEWLSNIGMLPFWRWPMGYLILITTLIHHYITDYWWCNH